MGLHVHEQVLETAQKFGSQRPDWTFTRKEVLDELSSHLNWSTVNTHIVSRCCVNAPSNHLHRWPYFRRVGRGQYQLMPQFRRKPSGPPDRGSERPAAKRTTTGRRSTIHAVISRDEQTYVAECLEVAVVTQADSLDELLTNLNDALALHLEGENLEALGLSDSPSMQLLYETPLAV